MAGLLHVVKATSRNGKGSFFDIPFREYFTISDETMTAVVKLGKHFLAHAIACYGIFGANKAERDAVYIFDRLKKHKTA